MFSKTSAFVKKNVCDNINEYRTPINNVNICQGKNIIHKIVLISSVV